MPPGRSETPVSDVREPPPGRSDAGPRKSWLGVRAIARIGASTRSDSNRRSDCRLQQGRRGLMPWLASPQKWIEHFAWPSKALEIIYSRLAAGTAQHAHVPQNVAPVLSS